MKELMSKEEKVMKATKKIMVIGLMVLLPAQIQMAQATAPTYQNTYKPMHDQAAYVMPTTATFTLFVMLSPS